MIRTKTGWVAQAEGAKSFSIEGKRAQGVYLNYTRARLYLYFAGMDGPDNEASVLPPDPALLRELATALDEAADELEDTEYRPRLHMLIE